LWLDAEIHGVDIVRNPQLPEYIQFAKVNLDVLPLPFPDGHFDAIVFTHVIEHLANPYALGAEINRIMRSGGELYVEAPNWTAMLIPSLGFHREQGNPINFFDDPTHLRPWTKQALYEFVSSGCSFEIAALGTVRNWLRLPFDIPLLLAGLLIGNRGYVVNAIWNISGWCIYAHGRKA
jgi:SAM-dependent methyltransferase